MKFKKRILCNIYDIGGDIKFRNIWSNYYADLHGIVYVIDASAKNRLEESKKALHELAKNYLLIGKPMLM
jgi:ADP-ribosylation factor-like protein 13B